MSQAKDLALTIASVIDSKKGEDIMILGVNHLTSITDYFVIASAKNVLQVKAIAEEIEDKLAQDGQLPRRKEGYSDARWIVLDFNFVIVHIFHAEEREYYNIERLWMDGSNQIEFIGGM